jgi:carboxymethylenebutenolidase
VSQPATLTIDTQKLAAIWEEHVRAEFEGRSVNETISTMVANPRAHLAPVMLGGDGKEGVSEFYKRFVPQIQQDAEMVPVSRTVGQERVVKEMIFRFTHNIRMESMLPGIPPTCRRVEIPFLIVVQFDGNKMTHEHLYWDRSSVLVQLGVLAPALQQVVGAIARRSQHCAELPAPSRTESSPCFSLPWSATFNGRCFCKSNRSKRSRVTGLYKEL